ncbi:hypothetical protein FACS1894164_13840 [Spirochaetia bacterium]|nr:hypothetical protein FACS1894164_13840 [Spirochaetia bacterium]
MKFSIQIIDSDGRVKAEAVGEEIVHLVYLDAYTEGDSISASCGENAFVIMQMEDSIQPVYGFLKGVFRLKVPFGEKRESYSPKSFIGNQHLLWIREASESERAQYRNMALNPLDNHENSAFFPHVVANVETRGESVFAARNAIDGNTANKSHGPWPYESWGINCQDDAEITIHFGRVVEIDRLLITLRSDFPHDNWWKEATITFSDGSIFKPHFSKTALPQEFKLDSVQKIEWLKMSNMKKDEAVSSPYPALTQIEVFGREA